MRLSSGAIVLYVASRNRFGFWAIFVRRPNNRPIAVREDSLDQQDPKEEPIETVFRNGTVTVVGILLAFSLGFVTHWAANPVPWRLYDLFAVVPILGGIALQMRALSILLEISSLRRQVFERANRIFMFGLILTACGVGLAILLDVFEMSVRSTLPGR